MTSALYLTYDGLLEPLGASQVIPYVTGLAARGTRMTVLSFEKPGDLRAPDRVGEVERRLRESGVDWIRRRWHGTPTLPATAFDLWTGRRAVRRWAASRSGPALLHARGYLPGYMALAGRALDTPLLLDLRGFWVDERIEGGYWRPGSAQERIGRRVERAILDGADHLISLTRKGVRRLPELWPGAAGTPATVIPTCVRTGLFRPPEDRAAVRRELGLDPEAPTLIHVGTITGWYDGDATVRVGRAFVERTGGSFVLLTRDRAAAEALARKHGVEARIESARPDEVPRWLQAADAGLALVRVSPAKDASFATKIAEYLSTGLAVLATGIGDMPDFADDAVLALLDGRTPEEGAAWLAEAIPRPDRVARARELATRELSMEVALERLAPVYEELFRSVASRTSR